MKFNQQFHVKYKNTHVIPPFERLACNNLASIEANTAVYVFTQ